MAVITKYSTMQGGLTPACSDCGISLCWDISKEEYNEKLEFWDEWRCRDCYPEYKEKQND